MIPHMNGLLVFIEMKQKIILFLKKEIQNGRLKKEYFSAPPILNIFLQTTYLFTFDLESAYSFMLKLSKITV